MIIFKISPRNTDVSHSITVVSELYYAHRSEYILYQSVSECIIIIGANTIVIHVLTLSRTVHVTNFDGRAMVADGAVRERARPREVVRVS